MVAANRVAAINPPIDDTDPIRKFSIDPGSHTDLQNPAEFSPKGKPIRNFSINPTSSIQTQLRAPFLRTPFPRLLNPWFGEPVVCTLDSRGFRHFRGFRDFCESSTQLLVCSCLSCLRRFRRFRAFRHFRERRPVCQTIGLANHRFRNARIVPSRKVGVPEQFQSKERGRVQRKWVQPENVIFAQNLACSRQNPAKSRQKPQNPAVPTHFGCTLPKLETPRPMLTAPHAQSIIILRCPCGASN